MDHIVTFETVYRECTIEPTITLFRFLFHILPMNTDRNRVVIVGRPGFLLFEHLVDRAHSWQDIFFFMEFNHLGPIDPVCLPPEGWAPLDSLKSRTTIIPAFCMTFEEQKANDILTTIYHCGPLDFRKFKHGWTLERHMRRLEGDWESKVVSPPSEEEIACD